MQPHSFDGSISNSGNSRLLKAKYHKTDDSMEEYALKTDEKDSRREYDNNYNNNYSFECFCKVKRILFAQVQTLLVKFTVRVLV